MFVYTRIKYFKVSLEKHNLTRPDHMFWISFYMCAINSDILFSIHFWKTADGLVVCFDFGVNSVTWNCLCVVKCDQFFVSNTLLLKLHLSSPVQLMGKSQAQLPLNQLHKDVSPPGVLQGWRWKSLKISAAFVVVGSPLSSFPWPPRLPSPADPPPLWGLVSVRRPHSSSAPAGLSPHCWKAFLSLACPWGSSACCCQTNTAKIFFPVSLTVCFSGHLFAICLPLSLLFFTSCFSLYHPLSILCSLLYQFLHLS